MTGTGIVHFGPGAFHRAHQADYVDRLLKQDPRWGIAAVSLRSGGTVEALKRQQGRYTLAILDAEIRFRTLAAHTRFFGPGEGDGVRALLRDPAIRIVSSTVTEKGYCLDGGGRLDFDHPDIVRDLADPAHPLSIVGWLALGLGDRRTAGLPAFTPLCCDNMVSNGRKLQAAVIDYARRLDAGLADWIAKEAVFPDSMVDSITPATGETLRTRVREQGYDDSIPVSREAYAAWVIEDVLPDGAPDLASVGIMLAKHVGAWEKAKLRILNGAHSTLAYLGLLIGHESVAEAMADRPLAIFVERLIREDIIPSLEPSPLDLDLYSRQILDRFRNPAIGHKLAQIAWDGSQKLPYRLLDPIAEARAAGRSVDRLAVPIAAWMLFVERKAQAGIEIVDPLAPRLAEIGRGGDPVDGLLALRQVFPERLAADDLFRNAVARAAAQMRKAGPLALLTEELANA
ncbi:MAG: mannitol dehydrogenase family protein [Alphaproteobacteria bacterium]|nr:mannitol dehydrogenase family protein [Alphaproteobacteria bacterium]